jgi:predicted O-linked N-acetylglucosamine transferase (SPINDLY family)
MILGTLSTIQSNKIIYWATYKRLLTIEGLKDAIKKYMNEKIHRLIGQALELLQNGSPAEAEKALLKILNLDTNNLPALEILGVIKGSKGEHSESAKYLSKAVKINPSNPSLHYNLAKALSECSRDVEAIPHHEQVLGMAPNNPDAWLNYGESLAVLKHNHAALEAFNRALSIQPNYFEALLNQGATLKELQKYEDALTAANKAISLRPDFPQAWLNKGVSLKALNQLESAIASYDKAISLQPDFADAWSNKATALKDLKRYPEAIAHYSRALDISPDIPYLTGEILHLRMKIGDWTNFDESIQSITQEIFSGKKVIMPFAALALFDSEEINSKVAHIAADAAGNTQRLNTAPIPKYRNQKIKLAYFSADFRGHPTSYLMSQLFKLHNRDQFEIYAFSLLNGGENDAMRKQLMQYFDHFIDVEHLSDQEVVDLSRNHEIDIAVDLGGQTMDARTGIFALRAAPIQINYLGYPGTMAAHHHDYIIADQITIPPVNQSFFTEKIIYLPNSYQVNDDKKEISSRIFSKEELGLPSDQFIFCCFNNNFKITPAIFNVWMNILKRVQDSVLWLFEDNEFIKKNLIKEAEARGVLGSRLIFAKRIDQKDHLARHRAADLFLDTLPYNAHTTASDALWCGLPVITIMGDSFPGRVAASLLNAVGLPELITQSLEEYESLAIKLATDSVELKKIKAKLEGNRLNMPLFDTGLFCHHLESAYRQVYDRHQNGLIPDHILAAKNQ